MLNEQDDDTLECAHRVPHGHYDGAELRPYTGRPGAMDCFALPSRMGNRLIYPHSRLPVDLKEQG